MHIHLHANDSRAPGRSRRARCRGHGNPAEDRADSCGAAGAHRAERARTNDQARRVGPWGIGRDEATYATGEEASEVAVIALVDTSVWIDHLHQSHPRLAELLTLDGVRVHPAVVGELACGGLRRRRLV